MLIFIFILNGMLNNFSFESNSFAVPPQTDENSNVSDENSDPNIHENARQGAPGGPDFPVNDEEVKNSPRESNPSSVNQEAKKEVTTNDTLEHDSGGKIHVHKTDGEVDHVVLTDDTGRTRHSFEKNADGTFKASSRETGVFTRAYDPSTRPDKQEASKVRDVYTIKSERNPHGSEGGKQVHDILSDKDLEEKTDLPPELHDAINPKRTKTTHLETVQHEDDEGSTEIYAHKNGGKIHVDKDSLGKVNRVVLTDKSGKVRHSFQKDSNGAVTSNASETGLFIKAYDPHKKANKQEASRVKDYYLISSSSNHTLHKDGKEVIDIRHDKNLHKYVKLPQAYHDAIRSN